VSLDRVAGSNHNLYLKTHNTLMSVVCFQVDVLATGRSLAQRSPTESGVSECGRETSTMRRPRPTRAVER